MELTCIIFEHLLTNSLTHRTHLPLISLTSLSLILHRRANGELMTPATWMRQFVTSHPAYQHDSVINPEVAHDLMVACKEIGEGTRQCPELLGNIVIDK